MLAAQQGLAVVFDGNRALTPAQLVQQIANSRSIGERGGLPVGDDGDAQDRMAAAALAAAFFSALPARTLPSEALSTMSATDRNVPGRP